MPRNSTNLNRSSLPPLRLLKREERRVRSGHLWIYSNEIDQQATPLKALEPGQQVELQSATGRPLAIAYVNPHTLLCARIVSRSIDQRLDRELIAHRIASALQLRQMLFNSTCYRLVHGEGDDLPGLVIDRHGDVAVVQITTAGMERLRGEIIDALRGIADWRAIILRNDTAARRLEGLDEGIEVIDGVLPERVEIEENGTRFQLSPAEGQKTGWFYDQRDNRARILPFVEGKRLLDLFSYSGGWSVAAARHGASRSVAVDSSEYALDQLVTNAHLNGVEDRVTTIRGDAFAICRQLREEGERFDIVICDPPAFIKRKRDHKEGFNAYQRINQEAIALATDNALLVSASCSYHLERDSLQQAVASAAHQQQRRLQIIGYGTQAADHPIHPRIQETAYLKAFFCRLSLP